MTTYRLTLCDDQGNAACKGVDEEFESEETVTEIMDRANDFLVQAEYDTEKYHYELEELTDGCWDVVA